MLKLGDIWVAIRGDRSDLDRTLANAERKSRSWASGVSNFLSNAFSFAVGGVIQSALGGLTTAIIRLREGMIGSNADLEQFNTQFSVLLGNTELAQRRMEDLAQFGATTPFDLPGVVEADRILQGFGLHAADAAQRFGKAGEEIRRIAGDVAAGTGASFQELATLLGRFASGDTGDAIRRMQELGITTREQLAAMGVEFDKAGSLVTPVDEAMTAILQIMEEKYGGMMDAQSRTFSGMLSNLRDWLGNTARELGRPIFEKLKAGLQSFLEFIQPGGPADNALRQFTQTVRLALDTLSDLARALVGDVSGRINSFVEMLGQRLRQVNEFLRQLRDEIAGLSAGDILGQLPAALDEINSRLNQSLEDLRQRHESTIAKLEGQLEVAGDRLGQAMAEIAEKYGPKIARLEEKIAETAGDFQERLTEQAETFAKRRVSIEEEIAKRSEALEEKLTDLKTEHQRRRRQLTTGLMLAESEEQYLQIQEQIKAEDERYQEQSKKAKDSNKEQVSELKARLKEEEKEQEKAEKRLKKQRDRTLRDLNRQLAEIQAKRDEETQTVQDEYDKQVNALTDKLRAEKDAYSQQQEEIRQLFTEQTAAMEADIRARAEAIGTGLAARIGAGVREALDWFDRLKASIRDFVTTHAEELKGALIGIGAVLLGAGLVAGLTALAGLIGSLLSPIGLLVVAVGALGAAWTGNWGDIRGKTQAVLDFLQPYWERLKETLTNFKDEALPRLKEAWQTLVTVWQERLQPALQRLIEALGLSMDKTSLLEGVLWLLERVLNAAATGLEYLSPLIELWANNVAWAIEQATIFIENMVSLKDAVGGLFDVFDGVIDRIKELGEKLPEVKLPDWMTPGSPTPWEIGLRGVAKALDDLDPKLKKTFDLKALGGGGGNTYINRMEFSQVNQVGQNGEMDIDKMLSQLDERTQQLFLQMFQQVYEGTS